MYKQPDECMGQGDASGQSWRVGGVTPCCVGGLCT